MSKGPGKVERAIREGVAKRRHGADRVELDTFHLCTMAFGDVDTESDWIIRSKAQRVSALRAMHRIMATEPGWTTERAFGDALHFVWQWQRTGADGKAPKPQAVHELILAASPEGRKLVWGQAVITSRGGRSVRQVTVEYEGHSYRGKEFPDGRIDVRGFDSRTAFFCHERARAKVEEAHDRRQRINDANDQMAHDRRQHAAAAINQLTSRRPLPA